MIVNLKFKIFKYSDASILEESINSFLSEKKNRVIVNSNHSILPVSSDDDEVLHVVTVFYTEAERESAKTPIASKTSNEIWVAELLVQGTKKYWTGKSLINQIDKFSELFFNPDPEFAFKCTSKESCAKLINQNDLNNAKPVRYGN